MDTQIASDPAMDLEFLAGGGAMGERIRAYPWARTSLGDPQFWPRGLRTAVRVLLTTHHPIFILWGPELICFYNDAYSHSLGPEKHPAILGAPGREAWEETWHIVGAQFEQVMRGGGATWHENQLVPMIRHGGLQDVYWTYSYSPIDEPDSLHGVGGVLVICNETTAQVLAERRHAFLVKLDDAVRNQRTASTIVSAAIELLGRDLQASRVGFGLVQADDETIVLETTYVDGVVPLAGAYPLSEFGPRNIELQRRGVTVIHNDVAAAPDIDVARYEAIQTRAFVSVPLVRDGRFQASLFVNSAKTRAWSTYEVSLIESVAARLFDAVERARAEQDVRRLYDQAQGEKKRLSLVLNNIRDEVWFHDAEGKVILANPAAQEAFGKVDGREITSHTAGIEIFRSDGSPRPVNENPIVRALAGEEVRDLEEIVKLPMGGELRTRSVTSIPARGPDGAVLGVVSLVRDVTEQAEADRALASTRARLDYATRLSGVGFWYCDLPFDELQWDERVKEHFFFESTARITIDDFYARIHQQDRAATREAIDASVRNQTPYDIIYRTVHPTTGDVKWIRALGGTDYASDGTPLHFDGVTVDASAQKLAQQRLADLNQQLQEQDRLKDEFLATLAHELRNPLAPIRNAAELCARVIPIESPAHPAIGIVKRQVGQLSRIVDDLLDVSRISQRRIDLKMDIVELDQLIDMACETVAPLMREKQHELSVIHTNEPVYVRGDSGRLVQALANVLNNAAKYTEVRGQIRVSTEVRGDLVSIEIADNGAGISADLLPRVFELFTQSERTLDRAQGGLGIGLSIVKQLVEMHGGQCVARSPGIGRGSTFEITLPRSSPIDEGPAAALESSRSRRRILIVDDNADAAISLAEVLRMEGHACEALFSAQEALEKAAMMRPDFVLLDIGLPGLDGYEVARRLRKIDGLQDVGLIALTGYGQPDDLERARDAGFDEHCVKPVDFEQLERKLAQWQSRQRTTRG